jgi:hypothetical protein
MRDRRRVGCIGGEALGPGLGGEPRELIDVARCETELEAGRRQGACDRGADASTRSDDQRSAIGKLGHGDVLALVEGVLLEIE